MKIRSALLTEDGVFVTTTGQVNGRQATEKWYNDLFQQWHPKNHLTKFDGNVVHVIGTGDALWASGEWSDTGQV
jgi:ketosteroid isomerase-like protein